MKMTFPLLAGGLLAAFLATAAQAQMTGPQAVDCAKARNPERCEARQCIKGNMPPPDCAKASNPARCAAMQAAQEACRGKVGPAHRQCLRDAAR
jgi:hypothetical protein